MLTKTKFTNTFWIYLEKKMQGKKSKVKVSCILLYEFNIQNNKTLICKIICCSHCETNEIIELFPRYI